MSLVSKWRDKSAASRIKSEEAFTSEGYSKENPFYYPKRSEKKSASVLLRLLPSANEDEFPYILTYSHGFKGDDGRWLFQDLCPTSYNGTCPICQCNNKLWNTGDPAFQDIARKRARRKNYIANVYVLSDPQQPEKEGKVHPFKFGPQIFGIIKTAIKPEFEDDEPCFPFDLFEGADFNLKIVNDPSKGMITYAKSSFINKGSAFLDGDDAAIDAVMEQAQPLSKWLDPSLSKAHGIVLRACQGAYLHSLDIAGSALKSEAPKSLPTDEDLPAYTSKPAAQKKPAQPQQEEDGGDDVVPEPKQPSKPAPKASKSVPPAKKAPEPVDEDDDDDDLAYFKKIAAS